ncbi:MAG: flavin reductase [Zoogloeaceae bacterium]|nr:flavin reductase [Zoogloeaceae bacterium]
METREFRNAMSLLGAAVNVVTTDGPAGRRGFTATAVASVTDTPPTLLVCMNRASCSHPAFRANGVLCVNVLSGAQENLSSVFADARLEAETRFAHARWDILETGAPALSDAIVNFDCRIVNTSEVGTHSVFFCEIDAIRQGAAQTGLVYFNRAYHVLGQ